MDMLPHQETVLVVVVLDCMEMQHSAGEVLSNKDLVILVTLVVMNVLVLASINVRHVRRGIT